MLKAATTATRAPRGTKPVSQAFFAALESIPEASRVAVGKAALAMIRDEMKMRKDKLKVAAAKEKEKARAAASAPVVPAKPAKAAAKPVKAAPAKRAAKAVAPEPQPAPPPAPVANGVSAPKRRGRKPAAEVVSDEE